MRIEVTREHIETGVPKSPEKCALALALTEAGFDKATVGGSCFWWGPYIDELTYLRKGCDVPEVAGLFMDAFDKHIPVEPFEFELEVEE